MSLFPDEITQNGKRFRKHSETKMMALYHFMEDENILTKRVSALDQWLARGPLDFPFMMSLSPDELSECCVDLYPRCNDIFSNWRTEDKISFLRRLVQEVDLDVVPYVGYTASVILPREDASHLFNSARERLQHDKFLLGILNDASK